MPIMNFTSADTAVKNFNFNHATPPAKKIPSDPSLPYRYFVVDLTTFRGDFLTNLSDEEVNTN